MKKTKITYLNIFYFVLFILFVTFCIGLVNNPSGVQRNIFFRGMDDFFADFFNVLRDIADRDPYYFGHIYFPLIFLILYPFSQLDNFNMMSLQEAWSSKIGLMSVFLFTLVSIFLWVVSLNQIRKKYAVSPLIFVGLILSYIFFFTIERGNAIMLSAAFVGFFLCYYDSENKNKRIVAAISLALAVTLKIYPVLFGFLYFEKRQYKEICISAITTLIFIFVPFLFLGGGGGIHLLIHNQLLMTNVFNFTYYFPRFSLAHLVFHTLTLLKLPGKMILSNVAQIIVVLMSVISIVFSCIVRYRWLKISLLTMVVTFLPVNSGLYCGLYIFPMIIIFFALTQEYSKRFNIFILIVFIVFLNPLQFVITYKNKIVIQNYIGINIVLLLLWSVLLISSGSQVIRYLFKRGRR